MLNIVMLSVIMLIVANDIFMLSVIMMSVVGPHNYDDKNQQFVAVKL